MLLSLTHSWSQNFLKMGRRKKRSQSDDSFDEELAIEVYKKRKSFERPKNKGLETVFEGESGKENEVGEKLENNTRGRAPRAAKAKFLPKLRQISTQPYWTEDEEKSALRKKQTAKLFKGRKKPKWKGLTAKQEEKLMQKIIDKTDTDVDTEEEEEIEEKRISKDGANVENLPFIVNESSLRSTSEGQTDESLSFHTPSSFNTHISLAQATAEDKLLQAEEIEIVENTIKEADAFLGPLGFSDDEDSENLSNFNKTLKMEKTKKDIAKDDRRKSNITKVRRSSRLFRGQTSVPLMDITDQSNNLGSVFQDVEVEEKSTKSRRRSSRPKVADLDTL